MTGHDDFDRALVGWFEAEAMPPAPAGGLDRVVDATRRRRPRPVWLAGPDSHWVGEAPDGGSILSGRSRPSLGLRWSTALILLLVIAALVGGAMLVGSLLRQPSPLPGRVGHLAYGLDGDIFVADWDGRNPIRVADGLPGGKSGCGPAGYSSTIWSPDGRYLAYRSGLNQVSCPSVGTVNISDPNGNVVASFPGVGDALSWSPDSTRVATWLNWDSQTIAVYGLDGMRQALLTLPPGFGTGRDEDPVWSPDGVSLLISLSPGGPGGGRRTWELPVDGRAPQRLPADDPRSHWDATYSAEGARVAYVDGDSFGTAQSLVVAAVDGSDARVLAARQFSPLSPRACDYCPPYGRMSDPVMSQTGDRVAFEVLVGQIPDVGEFTDLRVVDVATGAETSLADGRETDGFHVIEFSPAGGRILFSRIDANSTRSLWSVRTDGSDPQSLVSGWDEGGWQWLPAYR
jgi:Tol biopolymer transport system component